MNITYFIIYICIYHTYIKPYIKIERKYLNYTSFARRVLGKHTWYQHIITENVHS